MTIKLTNEQITKMLIINQSGQPMQNPSILSLKKKSIPPLVNYWRSVIFDKIIEKYKTFEEVRQDITIQHAEKDENGNELIVLKDLEKLKGLKLPESDEIKKAISGEFISVEIANEIVKLSNGKITAESNGQLSIKDPIEFQKDIQELMSLEIDLGINKIKIDFEAWEKNPKYDILDGDEMDLILPIMEVENG